MRDYVYQQNARAAAGEQRTRVGSAGSFLTNPIGSTVENLANAKSAKANDARVNAQRRSEQDLQREFAQMGIQWRVQDAIAAGVSPLFALGAQTPSYQPVGQYGGQEPSNEWASLLSGVASLALKQADPYTREMREINLKRARTAAESDQVQLQILQHQLYNSMGPPAPPSGAYQPPPDVIVGAYKGVNRVEEHPLYSNAVQLKPAEQTSVDPRQPHTTASVNAFLDRYRINREGDTILLPKEQLGDLIESAPFPVRWFIWSQVLNSNYEMMRNGDVKLRIGGVKPRLSGDRNVPWSYSKTPRRSSPWEDPSP